MFDAFPSFLPPPADLAGAVAALATALGCGLLVGIERERRKGSGPGRAFAGLRTFALSSVVGAVAALTALPGLVVTGALEPAARLLATWVAQRPALALLALLVGAASISGLVNDTPVVVLLIPLIIAAAGRAKTSAATMLMPMNYAVLIGGMATTIGTSTNLIVVAIAADLGVGPFSLFSFYPLVAMAAVPALAYLWIVAPRLLGKVEAPAEDLSSELFDAELHVEADSWLDGRKLSEALDATGKQMRIVKIRRKATTVLPLPSLMKLLVVPVVNSENEKLIDGYIANLIQRFGGEV